MAGKRLRVTQVFQEPNPYAQQTVNTDLNASWSHDYEGRVTSVTYPLVMAGLGQTYGTAGGQTYNYGYDANGRLNTMQDPNDPYHGWIIGGAAYGPAGELLTMSGVVNEGRSYNSRLQLTGMNGVAYTYAAGANNGKIQSQTDATGETVTYQL